MKLTFRGAARTVTGSQHQVELGGMNFLLDCGLFQGHRKEALERNRNFAFRATDLDTVFLSHAHIDHSGNLPNLVKNGYRGAIHASPATVDLCSSMLMDSAFLQEKDAEFANKRERKRRGDAYDELKHQPAEPIYRTEDAEATLPLFETLPRRTATKINNNLVVETFEAGHMLGSQCLTFSDGKRKLAFSGDIGRVGLPIIEDPDELPPCDYLIMESTYGDRLHENEGAVLDKLADTINRTAERGGRVIAPAFAVGRTQQIVLLIHQLMRARRIPDIPVFVDSPLAVNVTDAFRKHTDLFDQELKDFAGGLDPFGFNRLRYVREASESRKLNDIRTPIIVISASGMCEAGRILHHLRHGIDNPRNTVLITGFQAQNTLGRKLLEKQPEVNIFGEPVRLRADVVRINELSGHADQKELLTWMKPITPALRKVFLVHGEPTQQAALKIAIEATYPKVEVIVPDRGESFQLD
jgi:metallo-beta-lactamase family protein